MVLLECKTEKRNSQCEHGQPMEHFARASQVLLAVNHNTFNSVTLKNLKNIYIKKNNETNNI